MVMVAAGCVATSAGVPLAWGFGFYLLRSLFEVLGALCFCIFCGTTVPLWGVGLRFAFGGGWSWVIEGRQVVC